MAAIICMYKIEHRIQIYLRNPKIACSTDHVSNTARDEILKICIPSVIHVLIKVPNHTTFRPI